LVDVVEFERRETGNSRIANVDVVSRKRALKIVRTSQNRNENNHTHT